MQMIRIVVEVETPVHISDVTRRLMEAFGVTRAGSRITTAVEQAVRLGVRHNLFNGRGGFIYSADSRPVPIRSRAHWDTPERKFEWVAPEELDEALVETVTLGFSMSYEDAISGALSLLGFGRATAKIAGVVEERISNLSAQGRLRMANGLVTVASSAL